MNKLNYLVSQLLNEHQTFESISRLGKQMASVNISDRPSSSRNQSRKKFAKRKVDAPKRKATKHNSKIQKPSFKKIGKLLKPNDVKGKCFFCHELGHWKRNYPKYLEGLKAKKPQGNVPLHSIYVGMESHLNRSSGRNIPSF